MAARAEKELESIKQLLMLLLAKIGASSEEIGSALKIHPSRVRQLLPMSKIKVVKGLK